MLWDAADDRLYIKNCSVSVKVGINLQYLILKNSYKFGEDSAFNSEGSRT